MSDDVKNEGIRYEALAKHTQSGFFRDDSILTFFNKDQDTPKLTEDEKNRIDKIVKEADQELNDDSLFDNDNKKFKCPIL